MESATMRAGVDQLYREWERDDCRRLSDADLSTYALWLRRQVASVDEDVRAPWLRHWVRVRADVAEAELQWRRRAEARGGPALERGNWRARLDALRSKLNVVLEIQAAGVPLKKSGKEWVGPCPFHIDRTPSLYVNPDKGLWTCHGCHVGGDIFSFYELKLGLEFHAVVTLLDGGGSAPRYLADTDHDQIVAAREALQKVYGSPP